MGGSGKGGKGERYGIEEKDVARHCNRGHPCNGLLETCTQGGASEPDGNVGLAMASLYAIRLGI